MAAVAGRLVSTLINVLYPERCVACGRFGPPLCERCAAGMVPCSTGARCPNCLARWEGSGNCPRCFSWDALDGAVAAFDLEGAARRVVHGLKYRFVQPLAAVMAAGVRETPGVGAFDVAYAVPLHRSRERRRGFNQAELILGHLSWDRGPGRLERVRKTGAQVGMRHAERRANVRGAFRYTGPPLTGLHALLVDDVVTTGATANECARVLKDLGARSVRILAFARANYDHTVDAPIED